MRPKDSPPLPLARTVTAPSYVPRTPPPFALGLPCSKFAASDLLSSHTLVPKDHLCYQDWVIRTPEGGLFRKDLRGVEARAPSLLPGTLLAVFAALFLIPVLAAQVITGQLTGRVTDPSGAVVPGVQVTVKQTETGVTRTAETNNEGYYTATLLPPGGYEILTQKSGFKTAKISAIDVRVNQVNRIDVALDIGDIAEVIDVVASAVSLETETGSLSTSVGRTSIDNLPLNTRDVFRLAFLSPGTVPMRAYGDDYVGTARILINGGRPMSNDYSIDGITSTMPGALPEQFVTVYPSPDAVEELRVQSNSISAEFGRTGGGVINTVIKSGTNNFHGTVYEFLRNSKMDANNFFANRNGVPLASFKRNQFGGTLGGPVLPNRLFFFFSYEGLRQRALQSRTDTVPTLRQRNGDFSQTFRSIGGKCVPAQIYDPTTTRPNPNGPGFIRSPFPTAMIPDYRFDKAGRTLANLYPLPTSAGAACTGINNYFATGTQSYDTNEFDGKMYWTPNDKHHLFFAASSFSPVTIAPNLYGTIADPSGQLIGGSRGPAKVARIDYAHIHGPTLTSNLRFGVVRWTLNTAPYPTPFDPASIGFSPSFGSQMSQPTTFPNINVSGYSSLGSSVGFINQASTSYNWKGSIIKVWRSHNLKAGGEYRIIQTYEYSGLGTNGSFNFGPAYTQGPDPNAARGDLGDGIASLLLGTGTGNVQIYPHIFTSSHYSALFVQDQWKITPRFSIEMGLRWEYETPRSERFNQLSYWDYSVVSPLSQQIPSMPNLHGGVRFVGKDSPTQFNPDWNNFGPRFGAAWSLDQNTVFRAGYGLMYVVWVGTAVGSAAGSLGWKTQSTWVDSLDGITPLNYLSNAFPQGLDQPTGSSLGLLTRVGLDITANRDGAIDRSNRVGYVQQWNTTIQRRVGRRWQVEAGYAASKGTKILFETGYELNQLTPEQMQLKTALQELVPNPFYGMIRTGILSQPTVVLSQLLRPYPQFQSIVDFKPATGMTNYQSFVGKLQGEFGSGALMTVYYTAGKNLNNFGYAPAPQNTYNLAAEKSLADEDVSRRLVASLVWPVPLGAGRRFGNNLAKWFEKAAGNWQVNALVTVATGNPLIVTAANTAGAYNLSERANIVGNPVLSGDRSTAAKLAEWFNTAAFAQPAPFTFGNGSRTLPNVRSDGLRNIDLSIFKEFLFKEQMKFELRGEFFNVLNNPTFAPPGGIVGSTSFGVVSSQANLPRQVQVAARLRF